MICYFLVSTIIYLFCGLALKTLTHFFEQWSPIFYCFGKIKSLFYQFAGPFTIIIGGPSKIEDVIQYADFTEKVSPVELDDETTLDEEPNLENLFGLMNGNITLNNTDVHLVPASKFHKSNTDFRLGFLQKTVTGLNNPLPNQGN